MRWKVVSRPGQNGDKNSAHQAGAQDRFSMTQPPRALSKPMGSIWVSGEPDTLVTLGLKQALEKQAQVYAGPFRPTQAPSVIVFCSDRSENVSEDIKEFQELYPAARVLVFSLREDFPLARVALRAGARGFIHAGMSPLQIARAVEVVERGEIVAPRKLLEYLIFNEERADLDALSSRQLEILGLVVEGLSNAEIGKRLYLAESTVKQHLRAAYKVLGVSNRTEAAKLLHDR